MRQVSLLTLLAAWSGCSSPGYWVDPHGIEAEDVGGSAGARTQVGGRGSSGAPTKGGTSFAGGTSRGGTNSAGNTALGSAGGSLGEGGTIGIAGSSDLGDGGALGEGGALGDGGTLANGGSLANGGTLAKGGTLAIGGTTPTAGRPSGGVLGSGGIITIAGSTSTGGVRTSGGTTGASGSTSTGGAIVTAGAPATGGAPPATGGAPPATGGAPNCAPGAVFCDNFESGTANWTVLQGIWATATDGTTVYGCTLGTNEARSIAGTATWTDYTVSARMKLIQLGASRRIYLAARVADSDNWYGAGFYNGSPPVQLRKKVAGQSTTLSTAAFAWVANQWYLVALKVSGTALTMSIDGTVVATATDTSFTAGRIALLADQSQISVDDVIVTVP